MVTSAELPIQIRDIVVDDIDCEFTFGKCNNFCKKDTLKTLVTETFAFKEKEVRTYTFSKVNMMLLFAQFYMVTQSPQHLL